MKYTTDVTAWTEAGFRGDPEADDWLDSLGCGRHIVAIDIIDEGTIVVWRLVAGVPLYWATPCPHRGALLVRHRLTATVPKRYQSAFTPTEDARPWR